MRSHGRQEPDFIPDAQVVFDPCTDASCADGANTLLRQHVPQNRLHA